MLLHAMDPFDPRGGALHSDLDHVHTACALWARGKNPRAVFEVSFRSLPQNRGFILLAGVEQIARFLLDYAFTPQQIHFLRSLFVLHGIKPEPWDFLTELRFHGDLDAAPEGTPIFPGQPFLRITAPLAEAILVETYILSMLQIQCLVATRAARMVEAAGGPGSGREIVEGGGKLGHGPGAGPLAARAAYIAGATGTTNLEAGHRLGVPVHGRMTPAMVLACSDQAEAFKLHQEQCPLSPTLLLDVDEPLAALAHALEPGRPLKAVRIDSGDLAVLTKEIRNRLDQGGRKDVKIVVGGNLDEYRIAELVQAGLPIDGFRAGGDLTTSSDAPQLSLRYDMVAIESGDGFVPRAARGVLAGVKQVFRRFGSDSTARGDTVVLADEKPSGAPMLQEVLRGGDAKVGRPGLETIREYTARAVARLPVGVRRLHDPEPYLCQLSDALIALRDEAGNP